MAAESENSGPDDGSQRWQFRDEVFGFDMATGIGYHEEDVLL